MTVYGDLITADGQIQWAGMLFNDGVLTYLSDDGITGWEDLPATDSGNVARPSEHGSEPGRDLAQDRIVTGSWAWRPNRATDDGSALRALRAATTITSTSTEQPIVVRLLGETLLAWAKIKNRSLPGDRPYSVRAGTLTLQWECSDPKRYGLTENHERIAFPAPTTVGLVYPLVYPLDYGTAPAPSTGIAVNAMETETSPRLVFSGGAMSGIAITNTIGDVTKTLAFNVALATTDVLEIDTRAGTVLLNGVDRLYTRTTLSGPVKDFLLAGGANALALHADSWDAGAGVDIYWRDATF